MTRLEHDFSVHARRAPEQIAVDGPDGQLSYGALDKIANRLARAYLAAGARPGDRIGVHVPRSGHAIAAMLAALRVGAAYVPLDPASPPSRVALIANDCDLRQVVIAPTLLRNWLAANVQTPVTDFFVTGDEHTPDAPGGSRVHTWAELQARDSGSLELVSRVGSFPAATQSGGLDALAYILYTSGSTGIPKGVMLSHRNALAFVSWAADLIGLSAQDRVASVAPFHFDLSVFDVWSTLSRGATIVIVDEATVLNGRRMLDRIHQQSIQVWYSVPSAWTLMLEAGELERRGAPSLRAVYFAGEVFPMKQLRRTMSAVPQARFFNLFGPTETNVCLAYELPGIPDADALAIPIGRPSCGDTIEIVDASGHQVAEGETGELLVEGPTVMLGYWDGGRRTPAKHPYPTGDLVSRTSAGDLMYHGRRDHMVKVHGYRIELGEVEAALNAHAAVREAIVFVHEQRLVAVVAADGSLSVLDLKQHCARRLPRYMIPSDIRIVSELPRTSSGKADRVGAKRAAVENDLSVLPPARAATMERGPQ